MPLLRVEAEKLSNNQLERGIIEEIIDRDAMFAMLEFQPVTGKAFVYDRENTIPDADFVDVGDTVPEGAATFTEVTARLRTLIGDVDVDNFLQTTMSDTNDQTSVQIAARAKGLNRTFRRSLAYGDSAVNTKQFDGIQKLVTAGQTITAGTNGAAVTLSMMDELKDAVKNGADAFIMRSGTWRGIKQAMRAMGGNEASMMQMENFGYPVPSFDGIPVLINDYLLATETVGSSSVTCSIYAVRFNQADGLHGIYAGPNAGVQFEPIGTVQNKDAKRYRLKWYASLVLKSTQSLARIKGILTV